jgi:hypothetical protein
MQIEHTSTIGANDMVLLDSNDGSPVDTPELERRDPRIKAHHWAKLASSYGNA